MLILVIVGMGSNLSAYVTISMKTCVDFSMIVSMAVMLV